MNGLYEIVPAGDGVFHVTLNPAHAIFAGHFPGQPVLPGICSLMIVRACAAETAKKQLRYADIKACKFLAAILPTGAPLTVQVKLTDTLDLEATICVEATTALKLKATLIPDE